MSFPRQFIETLQERVVLSDLVGKKVKLIRAGRDEFKACCPFHNEKTPSFTLNNQKGFYHCFGCGANGDAIKFMQEHENLSFHEAVESLAGLVGMTVPQASPEDRKKFEKQKNLYDLTEEACLFFEKALGPAKQVQHYIQGRALTPATVKAFRLGYAPADGQALIVHLKSKGYAINDIVTAGLARESTRKAGEHYSFFRDRLIFPVMDLKGRVVAFGGRVLPHNEVLASGGKAPKYINSSETPIFHKGDILYNLCDARKQVSENKPLIVVEGYMDVIALAQAGYDTAVAPLGTAMTESQIEILWRVAPVGCKTPILCFDGDNAGKRAALRAMSRFLPVLKPDQTARFAFLPDGEDPDSLVKNQGRAAFEGFLVNAIYLSQLLWEDALKQRPGITPENRAGLKAVLTEQINTIAHTDVRNEYMRMLFERFKTHFSNGNRGQGGAYKKGSYQGKLGYNKQNDRLAPVPAKAQPVKRASYTIGHYALATLLNYPMLYDALEDDFPHIDFAQSGLAPLRQGISRLLIENIDLDSSSLKETLKKDGFEAIIDELLCESLYLQAMFARPDQNLEDVREGWTFTLNRAKANKRKERSH